MKIETQSNAPKKRSSAAHINIGKTADKTKEQPRTSSTPDTERKTEKLENCPSPKNPFDKFSLAGQGNALAAQAEQQVPLLGNLSLKGQSSVWYAAPNTGKTLLALSLIIKAIIDGRIKGSKVYYINADDSASGMATKIQILDDLGVNTLTPGFGGFKVDDFAAAMKIMAENGSAKGTLIVVDTVKKFADLMSKRESSYFANLARQLSLKGGTVLGLAHTNKNLNPKGKRVHAGTSDLKEDFDAVYMLECMDGTNETEKFIKVTNDKRRGDNVEETYYKFSCEDGLSYQQKLLSVAETNPEFGDIEIQIDSREQDLIASITAAIKHKTNKKMAIVGIVNKATKTSRQKILDVLEKHTGSNTEEHLWDYERRDRGAHVYFLHKKPETEPVEG